MADEWKRIKSLGSGGCGFVDLYKCGSQEMAVKFFKDPTNCLSEIEKVKKLDHPNVVKAFDRPSNFTEPETVLFMEYTDRGSLRDDLKRNVYGYEEFTVRTIMRDIGNGVRYLHEQNITHRDMKPDNILVFETSKDSYVYKIADFGLAKEAPADQSLVSIVGTQAYWAPEQFYNYHYKRLNIDQLESHKRSVDYWALGLICHECITGIRPFYHDQIRPDFNCYEELRKLKDSKDPDNVICYTFNLKGEFKKSNVIVFPNRLCRTSIANFSKLLEVMLRYDKKQRWDPGFGWSNYIDKITSCHVVLIYVVPTQTFLSYPMMDLSIKNIQAAASEESNLSREKCIMLSWNGNAGEEVKPDEPMAKYKYSFETRSPCLFLILLDDTRQSTEVNLEECRDLIEVAKNNTLLVAKSRHLFISYALYYFDLMKRHRELLATALKALSTRTLRYVPKSLEKMKLLDYFITEYKNELSRYEGIANESAPEKHSMIQEKIMVWRDHRQEHNKMALEMQDRQGKMKNQLKLDQKWWTMPEQGVMNSDDLCSKSDTNISKAILDENRSFEEFVELINKKMQFLSQGIRPENVETKIATVKQHLANQRSDIGEVVNKLLKT